MIRPKPPIEDIFRTTRCFSAKGHGINAGNYAGAFPQGFLRWVREMDWWGDKRCYLCSGAVEDSEAVRVDILPETKPTHCEDARHTSLLNEEFDWVMIDPPYSKELAEKLYGTEKDYSWINSFVKEATRIVRPRGLIITLSYEIPKRPTGCGFIAVCGIYTVPMTGYMRCFTVSRKQSPDRQQSLGI